MTYLFDDKIRYDDSPNLDAFGGLRATVARVLGEYRFMYDQGTVTLMNQNTVGTASLTYDYNTCQCLGNVSTVSGDTAILQTKQYHPYISGTSNKALITFRMADIKSNVQQSIGLFDNNNGIFFRMNGTTPEMVIRKNGVDNEVVSQSNWNADRLDGSKNEFNPSGITADFSKCHIFTCDYQWLGVGRVRVGFVIDGVPRYVHYFNHANNTLEPYLFQPSLPIRWEIKNSGTTTSNTSMQMICGAVYCEGSDNEVGFTRSVSTDGNVTTINNTTDGQCVLAIKLKDTLAGKPNHSFARLKEWAVLASNDVNYRLVLFPNSSVAFSNTPVWSNVPGYGACQFVKNPTIKPGWQANVNYLVLADGFAAGATGTGSGANQLTGAFNFADCIYQNFTHDESQVLALIATKVATNADVKATLRWLEVK